MNKRTFSIFISVIAAGIIALAGMNMALDNEKTWDECYEMANAKISWLQTFHGGAWSE